MKGSGAKPYVLTNTGGFYSCTCPAWRHQSVPIERRTCKHLRKLRGDAAETARVGQLSPPKQKSSATKKDGPPLLLAESWDNGSDLTDWWMSEKLDGVRAYWDGNRFLSRQGNEFLAPTWFVEALPSTPLDGELWLDRGQFQRTVSIVRRKDRSERWREVRYVVFDAPALPDPFEERVAYLEDLFAKRPNEFAGVHSQERCLGTEHLRAELARIEALGGEGLMLREPASAYAAGRSSTLVKVKQFHDAEATVVEHSPGKGKHKGRLGALVVELADGTVFSVGTGLSDAVRDAPPPVGSLITFRYQELSNAGVPRFPSFLRVATDKATKPLATEKSPGAKGAKNTHSPPKADTGTAKPTPATASGGRRFELSDGSSNKFWLIRVEGSEVSVRYGRLGAKGRVNAKCFASNEAAEAFAAKQIDAKKNKGYVEV